MRKMTLKEYIEYVDTHAAEYRKMPDGSFERVGPPEEVILIIDDDEPDPIQPTSKAPQEGI